MDEIASFKKLKIHENCPLGNFVIQQYAGENSLAARRGRKTIIIPRKPTYAIAARRASLLTRHHSSSPMQDMQTVFRD